MTAPPNRPQTRRLGELLIAAGKVAHEAVERALETQRGGASGAPRRRLGEILIESGSAPEEAVARAVGEQTGVEFVEPDRLPLAPDLAAAIPSVVARARLAVPIRRDARALLVAVADPLDLEALRDLSFSAGVTVRPAVATRSALRRAIDRLYPTVRQEIEAATRPAPEPARPPPLDSSTIGISPELEPPDPAQADTVIRLLDALLARAIASSASDLHIEPAADGVQVRFRIDGLLRVAARLPQWVHAPLLSRLKVLARLDIAERRLPQDGAMRARVGGRDVDLRVATLPALHGEKAVVRVLDPGAIVTRLEALGMADDDLRAVEGLIARRQGLILATGPTGSGKTTLLYAIVHRLRDATRNLVTVEDPIEYRIDGITQVQTRPGIGLTFASCLRAILRQDPDVVLVGEIRDGETAEIAVRAAMTGRLVLSTLHTGDAPEAIARLADLGVPRFLLAAQVAGVIAQRLARRLCAACSVPTTPDPRLGQWVSNLPGGHEHYRRPVGCRACSGTGYRGRIGLFEVLVPTAAVREAVHDGSSEASLRVAAAGAGMRRLAEDGLRKVRAGITTLEELERVIEVDHRQLSPCPGCGRVSSGSFHACPYCGRPHPGRCATCGLDRDPEWTVCPRCRSVLIA